MRDLVNKFTAGELDPKFIAEVDYDGYRKAARKLRNVVTIPQGGATRRFGSIFEAVILNQGNYVTDIDQVRLFEYEFENNKIFDIIIRPDAVSTVAFDIYLAGILQTSVPAATSTYQAADIREIRWVKDFQTIVLLHPVIRPYLLRRITDNNWTLTAIEFQFFPAYDFTSQDDPAFLPTPNVPYTSPTVTFTPNATAATTVTASTAVYTSNHVGGLFLGRNNGIFRITAIDATGTIATGYTLEDFTNTTPQRGDLSFLGERAWNDGAAIGPAPAGIFRGWPSHGTFYQSRLVLGGSPQLPGIAFASSVLNFYDFDDSEDLPSFSYGVELGVKGNDIITDILASKSLILLGNKGPASTSILLDQPTTPANAFLNTQGTEGSRNVNSVIIDNQVLYPDRAGNTIWSMSYEVPDTGYTISNASILSSHLIRGPRWADIFDPDLVDGRYYMLVNSDGTMAVYNTILDENIKSWSLADTTGYYVDVGCSANQCKVLVRRQISTTGATVTGLVQDAYIVDIEFMAFRNITAALNAPTPVGIFETQGDYLLIGNEIEFNTLAVNFLVPSAPHVNTLYEYLNDTGEWISFIPSFDSTAQWAMNGLIGWTHNLVSDWKAQAIDGSTPVFGDLPVLYWIRIQRLTLNVPVTPVLSSFFIDTQDVIYLEKVEFETLMDCQLPGIITSDATGTVTGLNTLAGQNVFVFANDFPIQTYYVPSTGVIQISSPSSVVTVGLDFVPNITPMPVIALMQNGISVYEPVHVKYVYVDYNNSLGVTIQGQNIPDTVPGAFMTQEVPQAYTGYYKVPSYGGWDPRAEFVISQSYPAPMTILAVSYTMEVSP